MKTIILVSIFLVMLAGLCRASTVIIYNSDTKEVYSISPIDDAVMPETGYTKTVIKDDIKNLDLIYAANFYKFQNGVLITNRKKLDEEAQKEEVVRAKIEQEKLVQDEIRKIAVERLKEKGIIITEE